MKHSLFDIIIPCSKRDVVFLPMVIKHVRLNLTEVRKIYVITNESLFAKCQKKLGEYGVALLDENKMIDNLDFKKVKNLLSKKGWYVRQGWYFQQLLKMGFSLSEHAGDYYMSWDADTLPLSSLEFFDGEHPIFTIKKEYHVAYFETMKKLTGMDKTFDYSFIAEHMLFKTSIMKELITQINKNGDIEGYDWIEKCINACEFSQTDIYKEPYFSEFETYGTFASVLYPDLYKIRKLNTFRGAGYIRGRNISDKMLKKISLDLDIASFEYGATPPFPYNINVWFHLSILPKFEKMSNMPIKQLPNHIKGLLKKMVK